MVPAFILPALRARGERPLGRVHLMAVLFANGGSEPVTSNPTTKGPLDSDIFRTVHRYPCSINRL